MKYLLSVCLIVLASCTSVNTPLVGSESPLLYDSSAVSNSNNIVVVIPGALTPVKIFKPLENWSSRGYAIVYYRLPGLDGLPLDHRLGIANAAEQIAQFADRYPNKKFNFLGFSTGAPIAILAAQQISADVKVAAMSSAVERGGGTGTTFRSTIDILAAAWRAKSLRRDRIWIEYYRTLLFGRIGLRNPDLREEIAQIVTDQIDNIIVPSGEMAAAHTDDLRRWTLERNANPPIRNLRFYVGLEDPVISTKQTVEFAEMFGTPDIVGYPGQGHLLFITWPKVFEDIFEYFEEPIS